MMFAGRQIVTRTTIVSGHLCLCFAGILCGQSSSAPVLKPGRVDGVVLNSSTNAPLRKATVSLRSFSGTRSFYSVTDAVGRFTFDTVDPGTYVVDSASLTGYIYIPPRGRTQTLLARIPVAEDQHVSGLRVFLMPLGTISGSVTDDEGAPLSGVTVQALSNTYSSSGVKRLSVAKSARTDDRGRYRLSGFLPGHYSIRAIQHSGPAIFGPDTRHDIAELVYESTYYPSGGEVSQALPLEIAPGSELLAIDLRLRSLPAFHIRGRVTGPFNGDVIAQPCQSSVPLYNAEQFTAPVRADGQFDFGGLKPGTYCLSSPVQNLPPPNGPPRNYFAATVIVTGRDVENLNLTPVPLLDIQAVVRSDGPLSDSLKYLRVTLQSERGSGGAPAVKPTDDNTFTLSGVIPDTYRISVSGIPSGAYVKSIDYDRRDASDGTITVFQGGGTLTVHLAPDTGQLIATVQGEAGGSVEQVAVVAAAVSNVGAQSERVRVHYTDDDIMIAQSPEFLAEVGGKAATVTVHAYSGASADLKMLTTDEILRIKSKLQ
jgi:protocatechuate 3,4-dioxygenase beta subunit